MRFGLRRPCAKCPFRTDILPYLREERAEDIARSLEHSAFVCHETTKTTADGFCRRATSTSHHCAGALITLMRANAPSQLMRIAMRLVGGDGERMFDPDQLDMAAPVYASPAEFVEAHGRISPRQPGSKRSKAARVFTRGEVIAEVARALSVLAHDRGVPNAFTVTDVLPLVDPELDAKKVRTACRGCAVFNARSGAGKLAAFMYSDGKWVCSKVVEESAEDPLTERARALLAVLLVSKRKTDEHLLLAMRAGMHYDDGNWYENFAEAAVGDLYAERGRTRSMGIARVRRRGIEHGLFVDQWHCRFVRTELGRKVSQLLLEHDRTSP